MLKAVFLALSALLLSITWGVSVSHLMQRATKAKLTPEAFLQVQQVLISRYGRDLGVVETGSALTLVAALGTVWGEPLKAVLVGVTLAAVAVMILVWVLGLNPINKRVDIWTPETLPPGWQDVRKRWANLHVVRLGFAFIGFSSLLISLLF